MSSLARFVLVACLLSLGGCGSVTARTDGSASGGTSGTDAGGAGIGGSGKGGSGGGACHVELLTNGTFEAGDVGWTASPTDRRLIYQFGEVDPNIVPPTESDYIAWLGYNVVSQTVVLSQTIKIPADTVSITVSGSVYIQTDEDSTPYDFGYVETATATGTDPEMSWSNANAGASWIPFSITRPQNGLAGQTATFRLRVVMDDGTNTSFFFDNLSFVANLCP